MGFGWIFFCMLCLTNILSIVLFFSPEKQEFEGNSSANHPCEDSFYTDPKEAR